MEGGKLVVNVFELCHAMTNITFEVTVTFDDDDDDDIHNNHVCKKFGWVVV